MMHTKYDLLEKLGTTPFGNIFRGCNLDQQSEVAILELSSHFKEERETFNDIWNTILPACNLKHDFLVPVIDLDRSKGWVIMELRGTSLAKIIRKNPLPPNVARTILRDILQVLDYFQSHKIIHGDIRPETLLLPNLNADGALDQQRVKLGFSLGATVCGEVPLGQRDSKYLAPEMINGDLGQLSVATDLYSLAFTILEALVGPTFDSRFAQVGQDRDSLWFNWHGNAMRELPQPRDLIPNLPEDLATVLAWMLKKKVEDRPESAKEVLQKLSSAAEEPIPVALIPQGSFSSSGHSSAIIQKTSDWGTSPMLTDQDAAEETEYHSRSAPATPGKEKRGKKAPRTATSDSENAPKRWSRKWLDTQFKKPYVLWPFAVFVLTLGGLIGLMLQPEDKVDVAIKTQPEDVEIVIGETILKPLEKKKNTYHLPVGKHTFTFSKEGYITQELTLTIDDEGKLRDGKKKVDLISLSPEETVPQAVEPPVIAQSPPEEPPKAETPPAPPAPPVAAQETLPEPKEQSPELYPIVLKVIPSDGVIIFGDQRGTGELAVEIDPSKPLKVEYEHPDFGPETVQLYDFENAGDFFDILEEDVLTFTMKSRKNHFENLPDSLLPVEGTEVDQAYHLPMLVEVALLKETAPMQMTLITPGRFSFGVGSGKLYPGELPAKEVTIDKPFYIALNEVTQQQYAQFQIDQEKTTVESPSAQAMLPILDVSHSEAMTYCRWLGAELPTEVEWEYAASIPGKKNEYPWGEEAVSTEHANLFDTADGKSVAVDQLPKGKSPRGITHLIGNASEWCQDSYLAGADESQENELIRNAFVIRSPSFSIPIGPEARLTWRAPAQDRKGADIGFRPVVHIK